MNLDDAIELIFEKNCILFTGAGASASGLNLKGEKIKLVKSLTNYLFEKCALESNDSLSDAVDEYIDKYGEFALINLLKEQYTSQQIQPEHESLGAASWRRIYTTNYDDILENAYTKNGKVLTPVTLSDRLHNYKDKSTVCVHLNGYIGRLNIETFNNEFKLTDKSYLTNDFNQSEWVSLFRNDLAVSDAIFFVGFSMNSDLDLKRIISDNDFELQKKCFFILHESESLASLNRVKKFGQAFPIGLTEFANKIRVSKETYTPKVKTERKFFSFSETKLFDELPQIKDSDFYNLLI